MAGYIWFILCCAVVFSQWENVSSIAVPVSRCADKVACQLYSPTICTDPQYNLWATNQCAKFCNRCPGTAGQTGEGKLMTDLAPTCSDNIANCADYGKKLCDDVRFYTWIDSNCQAHCNRCSNVCEDKVPNCGDYGDSLCTELSYYNWVQMNCRKFCARCSP